VRPNSQHFLLTHDRPDSSLIVIPSEDAGPEPTICARRQLERLEQIVSSLRPRAFHLREFCGLTQREITQAMSITKSTALRGPKSFWDQFRGSNGYKQSFELSFRSRRAVRPDRRGPVTLEEVLVTAQKPEDKLQDVPVRYLTSIRPT
jgi:hypothetical protein